MAFNKEEVFNCFMAKCTENAKIPVYDVAAQIKSQLDLMQFFQEVYDAGVTDGMEAATNINKQISDN